MLKAAGIQIHGSEDKKKNLEKARRMARIAAERGAQLICFPELFSTFWFPADIRDENFSLAEEIPGPTTEMMQALARELEAVLILPFFEKGGPGQYFNTALTVDASGEIAGKYRKIHVPQIPLWEEKAYFAPGDLGFPVFETRFARVGVQICWDNFFPEGARILSLKGAQVIFAPTAAAFASQEKWARVICANAACNGVYIFRVNRVGKEAKQHFYGKSFCASPEGELVDGASGAQEGVVLTEMDLSEIERARRVWTFLRDRRPETYGEILGKEERHFTAESAENAESIKLSENT
ncbi:MAG: Nitrilase/cyanide hydratase and apolipoprotein N-acyltransferase [Deltaproteobacteria bacterium]|nr:Nitrilase/cyanide hydratase and apolipoprotein N-acyltransferase [Deltaproteobacteria bacterium]